MSNQKIVTETALSALASDIKTALSGKANSNDVYPKSQTYNRTEIDNALDLKADKSELYNVYPTDQESGSIAHITDGADNIPVKSLTSEIVAVESGSGEKSPDNPYTISGFDSGVVTRCGKNLAKNELVTGIVAGITYTNNNDGTFTVNGTATGDSYRYLTQTAQKSFKGNFVVSVNIDGVISGNWLLQVTTRNISDNSVKQRVVVNATTLNKAFTIDNDEYFSDIIFRMYSGSSATNAKISVQLEVGDTATTFEAYNGNTYTFAFGQTVYGGHFDNKGNLVVTHGIKTFNGASSESWSEYSSYNGFYITINDMKSGTRQNGLTNRFVTTYDSSHTNNSCWFGVNSNRLFLLECADTTGSTVADLKTWLASNNLVVVYPLANPITLEITVQDIPTLLGENNIFSNCGDVEVNYYADIGLYIDKKISSLAQA